MGLGDFLCYFLNRNYQYLKLGRPIYHPADIDKYQTPLAIQMVEYNRGNVEWDFYKNFFSTIENKIILDVGCGSGGKTVFYATKRARAIGIDIVPNKLKMVNIFARQKNVEGMTDFIVADAANLPFGSDSFDMIISNNAMQYFSNPLQSLREFKRIVKPTGLICINFGPPWRAPFCPETSICFPWTHLLFSQETIKKTFVKIGKEEIFKNCRDNIFRFNNKMTIRKYRNLLSQTDLKLLYFKLWTRPYIIPLLYIPFLKEYFCAQVISIIRKDNRDDLALNGVSLSQNTVSMPKSLDMVSAVD